MTTKDKQVVGAILFTLSLAGVFLLDPPTHDQPPDGCQPCDCSGAVVALPADVTALAADASAVTAVAK